MTINNTDTYLRAKLQWPASVADKQHIVTLPDNVIKWTTTKLLRILLRIMSVI